MSYDFNLFSPLDISNCEVAFATHRLQNCHDGDFICRVRRVTAGDEIDIYDFQPNTSNFKLSRDDNWIDGSGDTYFVTTIYDQSGNKVNAVMATATNQPQLVLNSENGQPTINFDGTDNYMTFGSGINSKEKLVIGIKYSLGDLNDNSAVVKCQNTDNRFQMIPYYTTNVYYIVSSGSSTYGLISTFTPTVDQFYNDLMVFDGSQADNATRLKAYLDNTEKELNFSGIIPATSTAEGEWCLGKYTTNYANMKLLNCLIWTSIPSETQRNNLHKYLTLN